MNEAISGQDAGASRWSFSALDALVSLLALALLAGVAIPSHQGATTAAREQEVRAVAASLDGAARFAHSLWQAQGAPREIKVRRGRVAMVNGYPSAQGVALLLEESELLGFAASAGTLQHRDARQGDRCGVRYRSSARVGEPPSIVLALDGC
jgi:hypothetical protein